MTSTRWLTDRRERFVVALLLLTAFALAAGSAAQKSVTVDEYQALPHGLAIWKTGDLHLATGVPLLPSALPALPLLLTDAKFNTAAMPRYTSSWQCGLQFLIENAFDRDPQSGQPLPSGRYHDYFLLGRLTSIAVLSLACGLVYGFARRLHGRPAGLLALAVACLSPNLLAHGRLVTPDIYLAAATIGCLWAYDRLLLRPGWNTAIVLGVCLGLAALCKLTGLLLFVLLPLCSLSFWAFALGKESSPWRSEGKAASTDNSPDATEDAPGARRLRFLFAALAVGLLAINAGYLFDGSFTPLGRFTFESRHVQKFAERMPPWLPVPVPRYFFQGIDAQLAESGYSAYLMGEFNSTGFYTYYLVALLVKTPAPVLLLCALAWYCRGRPTPREMPIVMVAGLSLLFFSLSRHKNIGLRYVLFLEPMMAVWIGRLLGDPAGHEPTTDRTNPRRRQERSGKRTHRRVGLVSARSAIAAAVVCLAAIALTTWPHYLPYFNWLSGGSNNGHRWLLDSNLDWGQDLIALRRYMRRERIVQIDLAHFGRVPPEVYGIRYRPLRAGERPQNRYVAISANLLWGLMYIVDGDLNYWPDDPDGYQAFRDHRPAAILGHSLYVFDLGAEPDDA